MYCFVWASIMALERLSVLCLPSCLPCPLHSQRSPSMDRLLFISVKLYILFLKPGTWILFPLLTIGFGIVMLCTSSFWDMKKVLETSKKAETDDKKKQMMRRPSFGLDVILWYGNWNSSSHRDPKGWYLQHRVNRLMRMENKRADFTSMTSCLNLSLTGYRYAIPTDFSSHKMIKLCVVLAADSVGRLLLTANNILMVQSLWEGK